MASTLTFAMGPVLDEDEEGLPDRFASRLGASLEAPVRVVTAGSYAEVAELVLRGQAHLAWLPPAVFVRLEQKTKVSLLAAVERSHGTGYRGVLFVAQGSPIQDPSELAGKRAAWVDPDSCAGHLFPLLALRERGLAPDELFAEQSFRGSHGAVVHAVMRGEADTGATFGHTNEDGSLKIAGWYPWAGARGMRAILVTSSIPADVVCASSALDPDLLDAAREALLALHENGGDRLLDEIFGGPRLVPARTVDYDSVRNALLKS